MNFKSEINHKKKLRTQKHFKTSDGYEANMIIE